MKIFCIGANKTGTTSLTAAMNKLGYKNLPEKIGYGCSLLSKNKNYNNNILNVIEYLKKNDKYDFFEDVPFSIFENYKLIDREFPESKFILSIRDSEDWYCSVTRWVKKKKCDGLYKFIYGVEVNPINKKLIIEQYEKRNRDAIEYFKERKDKLLVLNIVGFEGWEKLCPFLGKDILNEKFPHENVNK